MSVKKLFILFSSISMAGSTAENGYIYRRYIAFFSAPARFTALIQNLISSGVR